MDAVKYFKEKRRMVKAGRDGTCCITCENCGLSYYKNGRKISCGCFEKAYPEEAAAIVEKWAEEHKAKTRAQVFFERFPDAKKHENSETPMICVKTVGLSDLGHICPGGNIIDCCKCWNATAPDKYQDWSDK